MATAKLIVAAHKKYRMPDDPLYLPLHVGAEGKKDADGNDLDLGYVKDNTGDNISAKNPEFCELTGLYWAWKNLDEDYLGLVHYRRYFASEKADVSPLDGILTSARTMVHMKKPQSGDPFDRILTSAELLPMLERFDVFVPKARNYYIETIYSHYSHTHYKEHLIETRKILLRECPDYVKSYDKVLNSRKASMFNMCIMRRDLLDAYCSWLFPVLFELERRVDKKSADLSAFQSRFYGRISEILLNVWLDHKLETGQLDPDRIKELPYIYMEPIDWWKKGNAFLQAKFFHKKYEGSF